MGFMDKVKAQTEQLAQKAQQGMAQGQAKLDTMQAKKQADALLRDLGAAFYAEQRQNGAREAVMAALGKVDEHAAAHGPVDTTPSAPSPGSPPVPQYGADQPGPGGPPAGQAGAPAAGPSGAPSAGPAGPSPSGAAPTGGGDFSLDDL